MPMGGVGYPGTGYGNGYGAGYGGYNGVHNYENGITNPYRNTDTYKLSLNSNTESKPLPSETRKNFKPFTDVNLDKFNQSLNVRKINPILSELSQTQLNENSEITTKTFKVS